MKVNGTDIAAYGASFWRITPGKRAPSNGSVRLGWQWGGAMAPPEFGLNTYKLDIRLKGGSRGQLWEKAGQVLALFDSVCDVEVGEALKGRKLKLSLCGVEQKEYGPSKDSWHILSLECKGYEYGERYTVSGVLDFEGDEDSDVTKEVSLQLPGDGGAGALDITVSQELYAVRDLAQAGMPGNEYRLPLYGTVTIPGVCKNQAGKDVGDLTVTCGIYKKWHDSGCLDIWMEEGAHTVRIIGGIGRVDVENNCPQPAYPNFITSVSMPAIPEAGALARGLKVRVQNIGNGHHKAQKRFRITAWFTPVYI